MSAYSTARGAQCLAALGAAGPCVAFHYLRGTMERTPTWWVGDVLFQAARFPGVTDPLDSLVAALRRGEEPALALYLAEKRPQLLAFIENHMGPGLKRKVEADDILQEVSAEAIRAFAATPLSDRDPFSWLCQLAERRIIDAHRHFFAAQKRAAAREQALPGSGGNSGDNASANLVNLLVRSMTTPSQAFSRNVREENLHAALAHLPDDQREALRLRYAENKASKEIAAALGKSDAAVRVMLTRALKRLEELLGPLE